MAVFDNGCNGALWCLAPFRLDYKSGHLNSIEKKNSFPSLLLTLLIMSMIPSPASEYAIHREPIPMPDFDPTKNASLNILHEPIAMPDFDPTENASLNIHRGAIDQTTVITTRAPKQVMERMGKHLQNMGMHVTQKGSFLYRCLYGGRSKESSAVDEQPTEVSPTDDRADVVRFTVELTLLNGLKDTYSLDIRRLRGPLRRYKLIYDDIRDRARSCAESNDPLPESSTGKC